MLILTLRDGGGRKCPVNNFNHLRRHNSWHQSLERLRQASLLKDAVGRVPRKDLTVDGKSSVGDRAVPNFVIATALTIEATAGLPKHSLHLGSEAVSQTGEAGSFPADT